MSWLKWPDKSRGRRVGKVPFDASGVIRMTPWQGGEIARNFHRKHCERLGNPEKKGEAKRWI